MSRRDALMDILRDRVVDPSTIVAESVFVDPRPCGSMQLTKMGFACMREAQFDFWSQAIKEPMTFAHHTYLVSISHFPYYVHRRVLYTFDSNLGVLMKMVSGDFAQLQRLLPKN